MQVDTATVATIVVCVISFSALNYRKPSENFHTQWTQYRLKKLSDK